MSKSIEQIVKFKVSPQRLYDTYLNAKHHTASIGATVKITTKIGAAFSAHNGYITGKNLALVKNKTIVQTWRGSDWQASDPDSILILNFTATKSGSQLHMIHALVPDKHAAAISKGWHSFYWQPWQHYFQV